MKKPSLATIVQWANHRLSRIPALLGNDKPDNALDSLRAICYYQQSQLDLLKTNLAIAMKHAGLEPEWALKEPVTDDEQDIDEPDEEGRKELQVEDAIAFLNLNGYTVTQESGVNTGI